jgi:hypothetical protein
MPGLSTTTDDILTSRLAVSMKGMVWYGMHTTVALADFIHHPSLEHRAFPYILSDFVNLGHIYNYTRQG